MNNTLEHFFTGKFFKIPNYQRDFAWETDNIDDLIDDIIEAIETSTSHYVGTFILAKTTEKEVFNVVDGQQRLTSLTMLLSIAIRYLANPNQTIILEDKFILSGNQQKLQLLNDNHSFFEDIIKGKKPTPQTKSQTLLTKAYHHIESRIKNLKTNPSLSNSFLDSINKLEVMEFIENDDGKAIRIFQTVNDRGKPLSNMDKAKSLLIYYSNRFLMGQLDDYINQKFGEIFHHFNTIKTNGEGFSIDIINQKRFSEDSIMRYHFLAYADDLYDYKATENYVLNIFLKKSLKKLKGNSTELTTFINNYVEDLSIFFKSFMELTEKVKNESKYYKLFSILGLSAFLYPLTIRLQARGLLGQIVPGTRVTFLDLIEIVDLRVYKIRGTDPAKDISCLARDAKKFNMISIKDTLKLFIQDFMSDIEFTRRLNIDIYPNVGLKHILVEYDQKIMNREYSHTELMQINSFIPTIEHIFPREPRFKFPNAEFKTEQDYLGEIHQLGNLTILEKSLNSQCTEKNPDEKIQDKLYDNSFFEGPKKISAHIKNRGTSFTEKDINNRCKELSDFCIGRWPLIN